MQKKRSTRPFAGTPEQEKALAVAIKACEGDESRLMQVMQEAQAIYGYLPFEVQEKIADGMNVPVEKVYGVATFYAQFALAPKGKYVISVCTGTACYVKGAQAILEEVKKVLGIDIGETTEDGLFTIQDTRCLGCCGLAPVMVVGEDVYGRMVPANVKGILDKYSL